MDIEKARKTESNIFVSFDLNQFFNKIFDFIAVQFQVFYFFHGETLHLITPGFAFILKVLIIIKYLFKIMLSGNKDCTFIMIRRVIPFSIQICIDILSTY